MYKDDIQDFCFASTEGMRRPTSDSPPLIEMRCSVLQCVAVCCSVLQYVAVLYILICDAVCCSVLLSVAVCCSVLQFVAVLYILIFDVCCSVLLSVAVCCSVLQYVAVLYILILTTRTTFVRKNKMLALGVCFPQPCSSAGRRFSASRSRLNHYEPLRSFPQRRIR